MVSLSIFKCFFFLFSLSCLPLTVVAFGSFFCVSLSPIRKQSCHIRRWWIHISVNNLDNHFGLGKILHRYRPHYVILYEALLTMHFPKLRVLWCSSWHASAELFEDIKVNSTDLRQVVLPVERSKRNRSARRRRTIQYRGMGTHFLFSSRMSCVECQVWPSRTTN